MQLINLIRSTWFYFGGASSDISLALCSKYNMTCIICFSSTTIIINIYLLHRYYNRVNYNYQSFINSDYMQVCYCDDLTGV